MALYCGHQVRFRGRLLYVPLRYGYLDGAGAIQLLDGKPLRFDEETRLKIERLAQRKHARVGCFDDL